MEHHWEFLVVIYLFFGGLGAGTFVFSAILTFMRGEAYRSLARSAALIAPFPVIFGSGILIFDLGQPFRFWRLFSTIEWSSPMSVGSWLLVLFSGLSLVHMLLWLYPKRPAVLAWRRVRIPLPGPERRREFRRLCAAVGIPLGIGVGIYTGVLLGAVPARPFWNTPMVAMLFLFSALSTAAALLILVSHVGSRKTDPKRFEAQRRFLYGADIGIILLEIFLVLPYLLHNALSTASQARSIELILGGPFTNLFWIGFVAIGLLIPLAIEVFDMLPLIAGRSGGRHFTLLGYLSGLQVLVGGFILRWVFVYAGQVSHFG